MVPRSSTPCVLVVVTAFIATISPTQAADFSSPVVIPAYGQSGLPEVPWSWTGLYLGAHAGASRASDSVDNPVGQLAGTGSLYGDKITAPGGLLGLQAGYNWQLPNSNWVVGVEGAISVVDGRGSNTCLTTNALVVSANCRYTVRSMGTLAGRLGYAFGPDDRLLVYGKAGGGYVGETASETNNYNGTVLGYRTRSQAAGAYMVGGGLEYALTPAVSFDVEYEHYGLGSFKSGTNYGPNNNPSSWLSMTNRPSFDTVKVGVNYHFENNYLAPWAAAAQADPMSGIEFEVGARYWYSVGKFQKDLAANSGSASSLVSRLTYQDKANSGEIFGKIESDGFYLRGSFADGRLSTAKLNDEDWLGTSQGPSIPYSNTLSTGKGTPMSAIADIGYDVVNTPTGKLGASVGYAFLYEQHQAYGCTQQTSQPYICGPGQVTPGTLAITETDSWNGLRLGISGEMQIVEGLRFSADVAYLPFISFSGTDNHWLRNLVIKESGHGQGAQLQGILTYDVTPQFSIGAGARYWAMWADVGTDKFNGSPTYRNVTYRTERAGAFLQASYKFAAR